MAVLNKPGVEGLKPSHFNMARIPDIIQRDEDVASSWHRNNLPKHSISAKSYGAPAHRPHCRSARQTRERRVDRLRSRKKRLIRNRIAADLTRQNSRQRFRAAVDRSRTIRGLGHYRNDPRVNAIARPRGGWNRGGVKPSLETATRWRSGIGHPLRRRTKSYTSSARRAVEESGAAEAEPLSLSLSSDPEARGGQGDKK